MIAEKTCPKSQAETRLLVEGTDETYLAHIEECDSCAREARVFRQIKEAGKGLPDGNPDEDRVDDVLNSLLTSVADQNGGTVPKYHGIWIAIAASIVIVLGVGVFWSEYKDSKEETSAVQQVKRGTVFAKPGTQFALVGSQPDEVVRVTDGSVTVEVDKLQEGERFRIVTGDAEVEVRGTAFDVTVTNDKLAFVRVITGKVEVRLNKIVVATLDPGESWRRLASDSIITEHIEPKEEGNVPSDSTDALKGSGFIDNEMRMSGSGRSTSTPMESRSTRDIEPPKTPKAASAAEHLFKEGWKALREGRPSDAVEYFDRSVATGQGEPIAEDACFWRAVSRDRAGQNTGVITELKGFLKKYPQSSRTGEVSVMLGWKLVERGDYKTAKRLFESGVEDSENRIRVSAAQGLEMLNKNKNLETEED